MITQIRSIKTERIGNLAKITQLRYGSTERSGNLSMIPQLRLEAQRGQEI